MDRQRLDIIGDIHGHLVPLQILGRKLGYNVDADWSHPQGRHLVFVGDLIDRGPHSLEVAQLVQSLCQNNQAICLMGNHEQNIIEWRHGRKSARYSNKSTITDIENRRDSWTPVLDFFETLPLALELSDLRITHAVWHTECINNLETVLSNPSASSSISDIWLPIIKLHSPYENKKLRDNVLEYHLDTLLKGTKVKAPEPYQDNDGHWRKKMRLNWWSPEYNSVPRDKRIVFGHYWNIPPITDVHEDFVAAADLPKIRSEFENLAQFVENTGLVKVPSTINEICIDYNGVTRALKRPCVGAYRYPEAEVAWVIQSDGNL